ncbi:helix-turn-helix transcriptional regulator [Solwaraspora sp. WMMD1047]|uniref:helix-turn-helix transcriptional regulator n=1 Tax=Solwaraspora sp. WMMD1047 TaxID=3016102 RepID=UPI00241788B5|nr:helix-turn-helix transcriptional regulator [Solwaraspora sp. WMMD1047]MDG4833743.1 helix-turn-helix transcriptional regulator [Solwaraspora sp. WMMD1047]
MPDLPPGAIDTIAEIGGIASSYHDPLQRAEALLTALRRCVPFDGGAVTVLDTDRQLAVPLASTGYQQSILDYRGTPAYLADLERIGLTRPGPPLSLRDLPVPPAELPIWADYLEPAGFRNGLTAALFAPDGRHLGVLSTHSERADDADDRMRSFLRLVSPVIANAVDPIRSVAAHARLVAGAAAGVVLTRAGHCLPLPGLAGDRRLTEGSEIVHTSRVLAADNTHVSFVCPEGSRYVRVTVITCRSAAAPHLDAVVLLSPAGDLRGLTRRELGILGLLVEGWPNRRIAAALVVAGRTVDAHVAHILAKLGAGSRTQAAVRALRLGLYVPRPLNGVAR